MTQAVDLPWPDRKLSPNGPHGHWRGTWSSKKRAFATATACCAAFSLHPIDAPALRVTIEFFPPDRRRRDRDNMIAMTKAYSDGIAAYVGVDDAHWIPTYAVGEPVEGGLVRYTLEAAG